MDLPVDFHSLVARAVKGGWGGACFWKSTCVQRVGKRHVLSVRGSHTGVRRSGRLQPDVSLELPV